MRLWLRFAGNIRCMDRSDNMRSLLCAVLAVSLLLSLCACSVSGSVVGVWEQELQTSVLGKEGAVSADSLRRFAFREDGSGLQEHIMLDGSYPDVVREFHYHLKDDLLTIVYEEERMEEFSVKMSKNSLMLENNRGSFELTRAK